MILLCEKGAHRDSARVNRSACCCLTGARAVHSKTYTSHRQLHHCCKPNRPLHKLGWRSSPGRVLVSGLLGHGRGNYTPARVPNVISDEFLFARALKLKKFSSKSLHTWLSASWLQLADQHRHRSACNFIRMSKKASVAALDPQIVRPGDENLEYFEVLNVVGSSVDRRRAWLKFWEKQTGRSRGKCTIYDCGDDAALGGHMHVKTKRRHFILPICSHHNTKLYDWEAKGKWIETKKGVVAVSIKPHEGTYEPAV